MSEKARGFGRLSVIRCLQRLRLATSRRWTRAASACPFGAGKQDLVRQRSPGLADHPTTNRSFLVTSDFPNTDMAPAAPGGGRPAVLAELGVVVMDLERDMPAAAEHRQDLIAVVVGSLEPGKIDLGD